jgi:hypothetical protein
MFARCFSLFLFLVTSQGFDPSVVKTLFSSKHVPHLIHQNKNTFLKLGIAYRKRNCALVMTKDGGFSSLDNLEGSVLKLGPRVQGEDPSKKLEYRKVGEALFEAVRESDVDQIRQLCTIGINGVTADPDYSDEFGFGCLHLAAKVRTELKYLRGY